MQAFNLNAENFSDMHAELAPRLSTLKIEQKDILNAELLVEEIFWRMVNLGNVEQVKVHVVKSFFGKVQIKMTATGASYNPLVEIADWDENQNDKDYFSMMILKSHRQQLNWFHKNNLNVVTINVRSKGNTQAIITIACIVGGIICGLLMREFFSPETISFVNETIIQPSTKMFLNALNLLITPVVFFSIISGMVGMNAGVGVGKIGLKLLGFAMTIGITSLLLSCVASWIFFGGGVPQINTLPVVESSAEVLEFSFVKFIIDIIPDNFVSPIADGNILQIIFVAILFGISLNKLGNEVSLIRNWVDNLNKIFTSMMTLVMFFVPPIAFFAMVHLTLELNTEIVTLISKLIICQLTIIAVVLVLYPIFIWRVGKIAPQKFFKKIPALLPPAFATASSMAVMQSMMNLATEKLGISPKISSFAIPIGISIDATSTMPYFVPASVMFMGMYGIELDFQNLALVALLSFLLSYGTPAVPAACVICVVTIVSYFGVPNEIAALLFCIDALCDRILTCLNVTSNMMIATILARTENLLDEKIYLTE